MIEWYLFAYPQALCQIKPKKRLEIATFETRAVTSSVGIYNFFKGGSSFHRRSITMIMMSITILMMIKRLNNITTIHKEMLFRRVS